MENIYADECFQKGFESFAADLIRNINKMTDDERLIYKAELSLASVRSGNDRAVNDLRCALTTLRTGMSDYRFNKVLRKLHLSKNAAQEVMQQGVAV